MDELSNNNKGDRYVVISGDNLPELSVLVNIWIRDRGFVPTGGVVYIPSLLSYKQAMYRPTPTDESIQDKEL